MTSIQQQPQPHGFHQQQQQQEHYYISGPPNQSSYNSYNSLYPTNFQNPGIGMV